MAIRLIVMVLLAAARPNASRSFEVPEFTPNVTDRAGVLSASEISSLNSTIARLRSESHIYAGVLIVHSTRQTPLAGYSYLSASIGARFAAFVAGRMPNTMPMNAEKPQDPTTAHHGTDGVGNPSSEFAMILEIPYAIP